MFYCLSGDVYSPIIAPGIPTLAAGIIEVLLTFVLIAVVIHGAMQKAKAHEMSLSVGLALAAIAYVGGIFNPAVALGSMGLNLIVDQSFGQLDDMAVYIIAPCVAAWLAALMCRLMHEGKKPARAATRRK